MGTLVMNDTGRLLKSTNRNPTVRETWVGAGLVTCGSTKNSTPTLVLLSVQFCISASLFSIQCYADQQNDVGNRFPEFETYVEKPPSVEENFQKIEDGELNNSVESRFHDIEDDRLADVCNPEFDGPRTEECSKANTNLFVLADEESQWSRKSAQVSDYQRYWYERGSRIYDSLVPELSRVMFNTIRETFTEYGKEQFEGVAKKSLERIARQILMESKTELLKAFYSPTPVGLPDRSRLIQIAKGILSNSENLQSLIRALKIAETTAEAANIIALTAEVSVALVDKAIIPFVDLYYASTMMDHLDDVQQTLSKWKGSIDARNKCQHDRIERLQCNVLSDTSPNYFKNLSRCLPPNCRY